jgi:hypothetical protein
VAVDPSNGDVYTTDLFKGLAGVVQKFDNTGASVPFALDPLVASQIGQPSGLAVDPETGHVFVGDLLSNPTVYEFDASGAFVGSYVGPSVTQGIALDVSGAGPPVVYVAAGGAGVVRFTAPGLPFEQFSLANGGGVAVAPDTQHVFVTGGNTAAEYDPAGVQVGPALGAGLLNDSYGIGVDGDASHLYMTDNPTNTAFAFAKGILPDTTTGDASDIEATTVTLNGHVDPDGGAAVTCTFTYGTDPALAGADTVPCAGGPNASAADVSAQVTGLAPAHTYYYRLTASNGFGATNGEIESFTAASAPPAAITGPAVDVTTGHALLRGSLNPNGSQASYHFDYGTTANYGNHAPAAGDSVAGAGHDERQVARGVSGLEPGATYHYRLVATNSLGTTNGNDQTFTTDPADAPTRSYEMVSPLDNAGVSVDQFYTGIKASPDGNAVAYSVNHATYPDAEATPYQPKVLSTRGDNGWNSLSIDAPATNVHDILYKTVLATSDDSSRSVVMSLRALGGQGVEGNGNLYVYDVPTKHYTLVATSSDPVFFAQLASLGAVNRYAGGASDLSMFAFVTDAALTPDAVGTHKLYVWSAIAGLRFVAENALEGVNYRVSQANQVSEDGLRVYVEDNSQGFSLPSLYEDGQLTPISVVQRTGEPHAPEPGLFQGASPDGRYMLFTSLGRLTDDSTSAVGDWLLYRYDADTGQLEFLGPGPYPTTGRVLSGPPGVANGDVYFTSPDALAGATGRSYFLYHAGNGGVDFIAALDTFSDTPAYASPSGRYLAFEETAQLTSYDNGEQNEIYLYDAQSKELTCPSCRTDGRSPTGFAQMGQQGAAQGAEWQGYYARSVTDDGQVFFDTPDPLVVGDVNGVRDVYTYQDGRVSLISRGKVGRQATFMDATPSGSDVFFVTEDRLVGQDDNVTADLYDARVGGGFASQAAKDARVVCGGSECREPDVGVSGSPPTASERIDVPVAKRGSRPRVRVSVVRSSFTSRALRLTVRVSGRGRVRVAGAGLVATGRSVSGAGRYTLKVPLTEKARAARRAGRRVRVVAKVSLSLPFGAPGSFTLTRTLGR